MVQVGCQWIFCLIGNETKFADGCKTVYELKKSKKSQKL